MSEDFNQRGTVRDRCSSLVFASIASFSQVWISGGLWAICGSGSMSDRLYHHLTDDPKS